MVKVSKKVFGAVAGAAISAATLTGCIGHEVAVLGRGDEAQEAHEARLEELVAEHEKNAACQASLKNPNVPMPRECCVEIETVSVKPDGGVRREVTFTSAYRNRCVTEHAVTRVQRSANPSQGQSR